MVCYTLFQFCCQPLLEGAQQTLKEGLVATWIYLCIEPGMYVFNSVNLHVNYLLSFVFLIYNYYTLLHSEETACKDSSFLHF